MTSEQSTAEDGDARADGGAESPRLRLRTEGRPRAPPPQRRERADDVGLAAAVAAGRKPPAVAPGPLRTRAILASLGADASRPGRTQLPGQPSARTYLRETVFDSLVASLRQVDPDMAGGPADQLHAVVAQAAGAEALPEPVRREPRSLGAKLSAIAAMRDSLCEGLWALHEERPAEPLPFLAQKLSALAASSSPPPPQAEDATAAQGE